MKHDSDFAHFNSFKSLEAVKVSKIAIMFYEYLIRLAVVVNYVGLLGFHNLHIIIRPHRATT